jgi:hypothetical protein
MADRVRRDRKAVGQGDFVGALLSDKITTSRKKAPDDAGAFRRGFGLNQ